MESSTLEHVDQELLISDAAEDAPVETKQVKNKGKYLVIAIEISLFVLSVIVIVLSIVALYKAQAEAQKKQREEMFKSGQRPDMEAMRAKMEKERSEMDAKIGKVLTPEQFEKYKEMEANRDKGRMAPKKHHGKMNKGCCCDKAKSKCKGECKGEHKSECKGEHKSECKKESKKEDCKCKK